jgi:hypothetical protein
MSLTITTVKKIEFDIAGCVCGNKVDVECDSGSAWIKCECGLNMSEYSSDIGYGDTELLLCNRVVGRWNNSMRCSTKGS